MSARDDAEARAARFEKEAHELTTQLAFLEEEVAMLRRKLELDETAGRVAGVGEGVFFF